MGILRESLEWAVERATAAGNKSACPAAWPARCNRRRCGGSQPGARSSPVGRARVWDHDVSLAWASDSKVPEAGWDSRNLLGSLHPVRDQLQVSTSVVLVR